MPHISTGKKFGCQWLVFLRHSRDSVIIAKVREAPLQLKINIAPLWARVNGKCGMTFLLASIELIANLHWAGVLHVVNLIKYFYHGREITRFLFRI